MYRIFINIISTGLENHPNAGEQKPCMKPISHGHCIWGFHFSYWKVCLLLMMVMIIVVHLGIQEKMCFVVDDGDDDIAVYPGIQEICCWWWCCSWWYCCISWHPGKFVPISIDLGSLFGCKIVALLFVSNDHHFPMHAFKNQLWNYKIWFVEFCHTFVQLL